MGQYAVIGLGNFGMAVANALIKKEMQVIGIDKDGKKVELAAELVTKALEMDATDIEALKESGVATVDAAIVGMGDDISSSILVTLSLKELGVPIVITKATTPLQGKVLEKVGATRVIYAEQEMGEKVAEWLIEPDIFEHIKLAPDYSIIETEVPDTFVGKTIEKLEIRTKYGVQIIAIKRKQGQIQIKKDGKLEPTGEGENIIIAPSPKTELIKFDRLVIIGSNKDIERLGKVK
ncbi:MAG: TrkA family potassium uptake protein [bacterium]|nr:TrkA family potassium uptake protein [bacterium]